REPMRHARASCGPTAPFGGKPPISWCIVEARRPWRAATRDGTSLSATVGFDHSRHAARRFATSVPRPAPDRSGWRIHR
ncbi:hypothetical protein, partial [Burkholderia gladioli]|uniref:hypothetical protein n=1 Tax=Burkholderia gladioli TaxID=28095 RepID=UPI001ABBD1BD